MKTRTTINLSEDLYREAKVIAATSGCTLTQVFEEALRESFAQRRQPRVQQPFRLITFDGGGVMPGVNLDDSSQLLELSEKPFADA
ncbi:MAG: DUF2191 domain-containing protein [Dehalococcoidia bacterium]